MPARLLCKEEYNSSEPGLNSCGRMITGLIAMHIPIILDILMNAGILMICTSFKNDP